MAKRSTKKGKAESAAAAEEAAVDAQPDIMPEIDDDIEPELPEIEAEAPEEAPIIEPPVAEMNEFDTERENIAKLYRAQRDAEIKADQEDSDDEADVIIRPESVEEEEAPEEEIEEEPEQVEPEEEDDDPWLTLKIDGVEKKMRQSDVINLAQVGEAGNIRLGQANRLMDELKVIQAALPADQSGEPQDVTTEPEVAPEPETKGPDPEALSEIAERIQVGDQDDAVKALTDLVQMVQVQAPPQQPQAAPTADPELVGQMVRDSLVRQAHEDDFQDSLKQFGVDFPVIAEDPELHQVSISATARIMREELAEKNLLSEAELTQLANDPRETAAAFRALKDAGTELQSYSEVFSAVGDHVIQKFGLEQKEPETSLQTQKRAVESSDKVQERATRKRTVQSQPRQAAVRSQPKGGPKPKSRAEIVEEMRAARHYPATG